VCVCKVARDKVGMCIKIASTLVYNEKISFNSERYSFLKNVLYFKKYTVLYFGHHHTHMGGVNIFL